jgi:Ca2+/Na+ antiporter
MNPHRKDRSCPHCVGDHLLVRGASRLALSFGISPLVVGLTIVAFGTSAPEMAVSTGAVLNGQTGLAMGNVVGSNIFNVLFILGLSALIAPLVVHVQIIRQEVPILMGASLLLLVLGLDGRISLTDGALLFGLLLAYTVFLVVQSRRETRPPRPSSRPKSTPPLPAPGMPACRCRSRSSSPGSRCWCWARTGWWARPWCLPRRWA